MLGAGIIWASAFFFTASSFAEATPGQRILSIGGSVTEIVYALGQEHRVVARDTTSSHPPEVLDLPNVGYMRSLAPEGVLSVDPDLIISEAGSGPPETIDVLEAASIKFITVPDGFDRAAIHAKITAVAEALSVPERGAELAKKVDTELVQAKHQAATNAGKPKRVLFVLSTRGGRIMASGSNTAADGIIKLAGGVNAITEFEGYKPLSDEAITLAAPDVILMMERPESTTSNQSGHGSPEDELFAMPAIATTPAAKTRSVIRINGLLLLGFGPRTPLAIRELNSALYGGAKS